MNLGCDPEIFVSQKGKIVSFADFFPIPKRMAVSRGDVTFHCDNVAVEFGIQPAKTVKAFRKMIKDAIEVVEEFISPKNLSLCKEKDTHQFNKEDLKHPLSQRAGCALDFDAWLNGKPNPKPCLEETTLRCVGGHIHIGDIKITDMPRFVRCLDLFVGIPLLAHEKKSERRKLYGKAGAFRTKIYGVEYRTPSNNWVFDENLQEIIFEQVQAAVNDYKTLNISEEVRDIINTGDIERAKSVSKTLWGI